nr:hypothetical protein [Natronorubrum halophilum]
MRSARFTLAVLCCSLVVLIGVAAVVAAPPPTHLCGVCGSGVADDAEIDGAAEPGTLDIYVDESGDSLWSARVPVTDSAAERYRSNGTALEVAVDDAWFRSHAASGDVEAAESTLEDETVVVNYTVADVARPGVGESWIVDYFAAGSSNTRYQLAAQRVTIHAPDGAVVTNQPRHATVDDAATWTASAEDAFESDFDDQTYVTYAPSGLRGTASGYATIGLETGPTALEKGVTGGLVPGALIALAGMAVGRVDWGRDAFDLAGFERLFVAIGSIGAIGLLATSAVATGRPFNPVFGALSALGIGYAAIGIAARRSDYRRSTRGLSALAALVTLGTGALLWLLGGPAATFVLPFGLATALFLPIGYAFERRSRPLVPLFLATLAAFASIAAAVLLALLVSPRGFGVFIYWLMVAFWVPVVVVFGYPLALMGRRLARE